jgi:hypothetical protein
MDVLNKSTVLTSSRVDLGEPMLFVLVDYSGQNEVLEHTKNNWCGQYAMECDM